MNETMQLSLVPDGTPEQAQAVGLHYEIVAAAQAAANSLLALGRLLKQMRDTGGYKRLGFDTFDAYTEQAVGIRQRQAYTYITVVEKVPARLVEENAAAGVTKLALLAKLAPADQREVAGQDLAGITVAELKKLIDEKNGLAEQLSMMQEAPAAEAESSEVDMDALRAEMLEQARAEVGEKVKKSVESRMETYRATVDKETAEQIRKVKAEARDKIEKAKAAAAQEAEKKIEEAQAAARREQEEKDRAAIAAAQADADAARAQAEETAKELQLSASPESLRFAWLFEQMQNAAQEMMDLVDSLNQDGRAVEADKLRAALAGALQALAEQAMQ